MSIKLRKEVLFLLSFLLAFALYWPSMNGTPIWDDLTFWFNDPVMGPHMSYLTIWKNFGWPFSVSLQKAMLSLIGTNYLIYHLINFFIHSLNSLLVYFLGKELKLKFPILFFLLFLLHPIAVITTSWMIQIKTLVCFFFALSSLLIFIKSNLRLKMLLASWALFYLSVASKSASLTLPVILLIVHYRLNGFKKIHLLLPFFIISGWGGFRLINSSATIEAQQKADIVTKIKNEEPIVEVKTTAKKIPEEVKTIPVKEVPPVVIAKPGKTKIAKKVKNAKTTPKVETPKFEEPKVETRIEPVPVQVKVEIKKPEAIKEPKQKSFIYKFSSLGFVGQTLYYYFWQVLVPIENTPVKGLNYKGFGIIEIIHIIFLISIIFIFWRKSALLYLASAHILLLPFLGIVPAPFMSITWVSDQHLYLALPPLLAFWFKVIEKINWKHTYVLPFAFMVFFAVQTFRTNFYYQDQFTFYEASLKYDPTNVPIAYNLAFARIMKGQWQEAYSILESTYYLAQSEPAMRKNIYYPYIVQLFLKLRIQN